MNQIMDVWRQDEGLGSNIGSNTIYKNLKGKQQLD